MGWRLKGASCSCRCIFRCLKSCMFLSLRAVPIVRHTGGLKDTVFDVDFDKVRGAELRHALPLPWCLCAIM